jgi:hypothetical protein
MLEWRKFKHIQFFGAQMFSDRFYQTQDEIKLEKTAIPTGILQNPLDLINSTRPWVTVKNIAATNVKLNKVIIIADHLFANRDESSKCSIFREFSRVINAGFSVWILQEDSFISFDQLKSASQNNISIPKMSNASIRQLACKHFGITASRLYSMKYIEINDFYLADKKMVRLNDFQNKAEELTELLSQLREFGLEVKSTTLAENFIKNNSVHLTKCNYLSSTLSTNDLRSLVNTTPGLQTLKIQHLIKANETDDQLFDFKTLAALKKLELEGVYIEPDFLIHLINNLTNLENLSVSIDDTKRLSNTIKLNKNSLKTLTIRGNIELNLLNMILAQSPQLENFFRDGLIPQDDIYFDLPTHSLQNLKLIRFCDLPINAIKAVLLAAPNLVTLNFGWLKDLTTLLEDFPENYFQQVKTLSLPYYLDTPPLKALIKVVPNISKLALENYNHLENALIDLVPNQLKSLTHIGFSSSSTTEDILALIAAAPNLDTMNLDANGEFFRALKPGQLANLTSISFSHIVMTNDDFIHFLKSIKKLRNLRLDHCPELNPDLSFLQANQFPDLQSITFNKSLSANNIAYLLKASPDLTFVNLMGCETLAYEILPDNQFKLSKLITIYFPKSILAANVSRLLEVTENISDLNFYAENTHQLNEAFSKLKPNQLLALTKINVCKETTFQDLKALLLAVPNLKSIALSNVSTEAFQHLDKNHFQCLTVVYISSLVTSKTLNSLLLAAPNLTSLTIQATQQTDHHQLIGLEPNIQLKNLEYLTLIGDLSRNTLSKLLKLPSLKKVDLSNACLVQDSLPLFIQQPLSINNLSLPLLCDKDDLVNLLNHAPELVELALGRYFQKKSTTKLPIKKLEKIRYLYLTEAINKELLFELLCSMPNIGLIFSSAAKQSSQFISGAFEQLQPLQLQSLRSIPYEFYKYLTEKDAIALEAASPKLNVLVNWNELKELGQLASSTADNSEISSEQNDQLLPISNEQSKVIKRKQLEEVFNSAPSSSEEKFECVHYFPNISPSRYRLYYWKPDLAAKEYPPNFAAYPSDCVAATVQPKNDSMKAYPGLKLVTESEARLIVLPSLDPNEQLTKLLVINSKGQAIAEDTLALSYSQSMRFYWLTLPEGAFTIYFEVGLNQESKEYLASHYINNLKDKFVYYSAQSVFEELFITINDLNELANWVQDYQTGACLERSIVAYRDASRDVNTHIILNDVHAFIEIKINGIFQSIDLGGAPAQIKEKKQAFKPFELKKIAAPIQTCITPSLEKTKPIFTDAIQSSASVLFQVENISATITVIQALAKAYSPSKIFTVHHADELSLTAATLDNDGTLKTNNTLLYQFLSHFQNDKAALIIDMHEFSLAELAQLNELLDRRLDGRALSDTIHIKLIDSIDRQYGPDFNRRIAMQIMVKATGEDLLLANTSVSSNSVTIDLFNSPFWQNTLLGSWDLQANVNQSKLTFRWQDGVLVSLYKKTKGQLPAIVFLNPPLQNKTFMNFLLDFKLLKQLRFAHTIAILPTEPNLSYQQCPRAWNLFNDIIALNDASQPYAVLSDANVMSFVKDPLYTYDDKTNRLVAKLSHLSAAKNQGELTIFPVYGLSPNTLAQVLTDALKKDIKIKFVINPAMEYEHSVIKLLFSEDELLAFKSNLSPAKTNNENVHLLMHSDAPSYVAHLQRISMNRDKTIYIESITLDGCDLQRFPHLPNDLSEQFLKTGTFELYAPFSDLIAALIKGKTVVLYGPIPSSIYETLSQLASGYIESLKFKGTLQIVADPSNLNFLNSIATDTVLTENLVFNEKLNLLRTGFNEDYLATSSFNTDNSFKQMQQILLQKKLDSLIKYSSNYNYQHNYSQINEDEHQAQQFDAQRLFSIETALSLNPWVMVEGPTGIGKTDFLQKVLSKKHKLTFSIEDWINNPSLLVFDEASFNSELSGLGEHFFDRFTNLRNHTPSFYYKGKYIHLTPEHKVIFLFNPASYGAGRDTSGFLSTHALNVTFTVIPDYYLKARILFPILSAWKKEFNAALYAVFLEVYAWVIEHSFTDEILITPRELKTMVNLFVCRADKLKAATDLQLYALAREIAYDIAKQTVLDHEHLLALFNEDFKPKQRSQLYDSIPINYFTYQHSAYTFIKSFIESSYSKTNHLGLGAIILEGDSNIGKSFFIASVVKELSAKLTIPVFYLSPTMPFFEKEKQLLAAAECKGIVIADEFNTSIWPNKLLNNLVMGLDQDGKQRNNYGIVQVATQNPVDYEGRFSIDPSFRKRSLFFQLDWPAYKPEPDFKQLKMFSLFASDTSAAEQETADLLSLKSSKA